MYVRWVWWGVVVCLVLGGECWYKRGTRGGFLFNWFTGDVVTCLNRHFEGAMSRARG